MRVRVLPLAILMVLLPACASSNLADRASWLVGEWENQTPRGSIYEEWTRIGDREMAGRSYMQRGSETVVLERIQLIQEGKAIFYVPTVSDQNDGEPVRFELTRASDSELVFENPEHDFPQVISYTRLSADSLMAQIAGTVGGEGRSVAFPMRRVDR